MRSIEVKHVGDCAAACPSISSSLGIYVCSPWLMEGRPAIGATVQSSWRYYPTFAPG